MAALRLFARFLDWAGVGWPEGLEWPDRPGEPARVDLALPEEDYERLLRAIPTFPVAHHRPFLQALIPFLGETGLDYRETIGLWRQDYRGESLLVRGRRAREVPLSPEAREAREAWLPLRDYLASLRPIPYPHLFLSTSEGPVEPGGPRPQARGAGAWEGIKQIGINPSSPGTRGWIASRTGPSPSATGRCGGSSGGATPRRRWPTSWASRGWPRGGSEGCKLDSTPLP